MAKAKEIAKNVQNLNELIGMTIGFTDKYMDEVFKNADEPEIISLMGSQATCLYNLALVVLANADVDAMDKAKLIALKETMAPLIEKCAGSLGLNGPDDDDDDNDITDEDVDGFAKDYELTKAETEVLRKIVKAKGNPTDMTKEEEEIAIRMSPKIFGRD